MRGVRQECAPAGSAWRSCCNAQALMTASYLAGYSGRPIRMLFFRLAFWIHALCAVYVHCPRTTQLPCVGVDKRR